MTKSRAKGTRLERIAKRRLEEKGYVVIRAAASRGPFDLVALRSRASMQEAAQDEASKGYPVLCVQVKANRRPTKDQVEVSPTSPWPAKSGSIETDSMCGTSMNPRP